MSTRGNRDRRYRFERRAFHPLAVWVAVLVCGMLLEAGGLRTVGGLVVLGVLCSGCISAVFQFGSAAAHKRLQNPFNPRAENERDKR